MNIDLFLQTLPYMGLGMLGIFTVTVIIIICIKLLNLLTSGREDADEESKGE